MEGGARCSRGARGSFVFGFLAMFWDQEISQRWGPRAEAQGWDAKGEGSFLFFGSGATGRRGGRCMTSGTEEKEFHRTDHLGVRACNSRPEWSGLSKRDVKGKHPQGPSHTFLVGWSLEVISYVGCSLQTPF